MLKCFEGQGRIVFWALLVLLLSALAATYLQAQVEKATLSGTAMDVSGAVVVGAKIQAKNVNTGILYSAVTDGQGRYSLPEMPVGTYDVSAQKTGFQKVVQTGIALTVGARPVLDFKLPVGRTEEVIEVQGQASKVDTETAAVSQLIAPRQMENLPLNGRNFSDLLSLAPGVQTVPAGNGGAGGGSSTGYGLENNYSVSGSRPVGTAYMLDNTDVRNASDHGSGAGVVGTSLGMEAIQEFSILTNTYSAEFGGTGAAINAVTKTGTNALHGSAYEYIRNSKLDAMNYFDVPGYKPSFKRNQFGASLGGPIKKDKAFFFVNYEGLRQGTGTTTRDFVPTSISAFVAAAGLPPGVSPTPLSLQLLSVYPNAESAAQCPNVTNLTLQPGTGLYCNVGDYIVNEDYLLGRVDYTLGPKDSFFGRYVMDHAYQSIPGAFNPGWPEIDHARNQYFTLEERHTFSPKVLNESRIYYVRLMQDSMTGGLNGHDPLNQNAGRQDMTFSPGGGLPGVGPTSSTPSLNITNRFGYGEDVIMSLGAHSLRFGANIYRVQTNGAAVYAEGGWWFFLTSGMFFEGVPFLYMGAPGPNFSYPVANGTSYPWTAGRDWRQTQFEPYIQDDWKISKRLTLNVGVRYAWASNPAPTGYPAFVFNNVLSDPAFSTAAHPFTSNPNVKSVDPRIGVAFDPFNDHKTSIRAGFGMFSEPVTARTFTQSFDPANPTFQMYFPFGMFPNLPANGPLTSQFSHNLTFYGGILSNVDTAPYVMQYNLTVQRELLAGTVLSVGYDGSSGVHMFEWADANPPLAWSDWAALSPAEQTAHLNAALAANPFFVGPSVFCNPNCPSGQGERGMSANNPWTGLHVNPAFGAIEAVSAHAHSTYNSLQASLNRQFSRSLLGSASYTWSRCIDDASATTSQEQGEWAMVDPYNHQIERGLCSFNSNQVFTANAIYRLPFKGNRAVDGWQISPIFSRFTGLPFNVQTMIAAYQSNIGGATEGERPNLVPGCNPMVKEIHTEWWNPSCYVLAPYGVNGDSGRDSLLNPNFFNADFSIFKDTKLTERVTMQLRAEFFDVLNHPNFTFGQQQYAMAMFGTVTPTNPNASQLSNPAAYLDPTATSPGGVICNPSQKIGVAGSGPCSTSSTAAGMTMPGSLGGQRQIQFALKFTF
jgi:hypothetical protein